MAKEGTLRDFYLYRGTRHERTEAQTRSGAKARALHPLRLSTQLDHVRLP
ncbi:hypothetical protein N566_14485 [Streptomycetaceae bacterium MP113-05]|nr:hypothetical protein N566_14485 [Streptomycetaceae bacterium MP113-05]